MNMQKNVNEELFKQTAPDRLEMQKGGGCIGCFGIPFFLAGIFMLLAVMQIIPFSNASEVPWWGWIVLFVMGLVFTAVGAGLVFGRNWISLDTTQRRIWVAWGLLKPMKGAIYNLDDYKTVVLKYVAGDSDTADSYPVVLQTLDGSNELAMCSSVNYGKSREQANLLMTFLHLPLEDITTDHADKIKPDKPAQVVSEQVEYQVDTEQNQSPGQAKPVLPPPPEFMKCDVQITENNVLIRIPGPEFSVFHLIGLIIPLGILLFFGLPFLSFFNQTHTPQVVQNFFIGFAILFFVILPLNSLIRKLMLSRKFITTVTVDKQGIVIEHTAAGRRKPITLPAQRIVDVDYSTTETAMNAAWKSGVPAGGRYLQPSQVTYTIGDKPRLIAWMERLSRSKGVIIKSMDGLYSFGAGLPNAEVYYLYSLVKSNLLDNPKLS
jgi:hypothetical protein